VSACQASRAYFRLVVSGSPNAVLRNFRPRFGSIARAGSVPNRSGRGWVAVKANGSDVPSCGSVVRVPQRVFQRLLPERPTPEWRVEPYYPPRTRFESAAGRKLLRRQLTEDGHVEISGRDLGRVPDEGGADRPRSVSNRPIADLHLFAPERERFSPTLEPGERRWAGRLATSRRREDLVERPSGRVNHEHPHGNPVGGAR
jgi:hypothetical protein